MKKVIIQLVLSCLLLSCSNINRDKPVDKSKLSGRDYRLFQNTPAWELAKAVQDEDVIMIYKIVSENPKTINYQEPKYGNTLLKLSVMNQQFKSFKALLKMKADVNIHNTYDGTSALIESCKSKYYDIKFVQLLVEYGANINDVETGVRRQGNSTRFTPLIEASQSGMLELVKFLISKGANVNYQNEFDQSALSESIMQKKYEVSYYLLQNGANYKQPIFYRPDYSIPVEKQNLNDKGKPMYLVDVLRETFLDFDTDEYKYKMQIVDFLKNKGIYYRATPIPDYIKKRVQEKYPNSWKEYLEKY